MSRVTAKMDLEPYHNPSVLVYQLQMALSFQKVCTKHNALRCTTEKSGERLWSLSEDGPSQANAR